MDAPQSNSIKVKWATPFQVTAPTATNVSVAINDNAQVSVAIQNLTNEIFLAFGTIKNNGIKWLQDFTEFTPGSSPNIALQESTALLILAETLDSTIGYFVGDVSDSKITWIDQIFHINDAKGTLTGIAFNAREDVIEFHSGETSNQLYYTVGTYDSNKKEINWLSDSPTHYSDGGCPSGGINKSWLIVETHYDLNSNDARYRIGQLSKDTIDWIIDEKYPISQSFCGGSDINNDCQIIAAYTDKNNGAAPIPGVYDGKEVNWGKKASVIDSDIQAVDISLSPSGSAAVAIFLDDDGNIFLSVGSLSE